MMRLEGFSCGVWSLERCCGGKGMRPRGARTCVVAEVGGSLWEQVQAQSVPERAAQTMAGCVGGDLLFAGAAGAWPRSPPLRGSFQQGDRSTRAAKTTRDWGVV